MKHVHQLNIQSKSENDVHWTNLNNCLMLVTYEPCTSTRGQRTIPEHLSTGSEYCRHAGIIPREPFGESSK